MSDDLKALRTTVLLLQDWLDDGFLGWLHDDSECVELIREAPKNLGSLESQNQALQERIEALTRDNYRMHLLYEIQPPEKNALEHIEALQERAEKAEAALRRIANAGTVSASEPSLEARWARDVAMTALSPTQETDAG